MALGHRISSLQNPHGPHKKHILLRVSVILLLILAPMTSSPSLYALTPPTPMSRDLQSTLEYFLDADCGAEPEDPDARKKPFGPLLTLLRLKSDPNLEGRLLEILKLGLYADDIKAMKLQIEKEWEKIEARINKDERGIEGSSPSLTKEEYVNQSLTWRIKANQQKAAVALVLLNTPKARAALALVAAQDEVLAKTITSTYARFGITPGFERTTTKHPPNTRRLQE